MNAYFFIDSFKDKLPIEKKESAREYFNMLKKNDLFTPSDVIFMQFLLRETNCEELNEKCITYATTRKALCFYEERPSTINFMSIYYGLPFTTSAIEQKIFITSVGIAIPIHTVTNIVSFEISVHKSLNEEPVRHYL